MAQSTAGALETQLRTTLGIDVGSPSPIRILQETHDAATYSRYYCVGGVANTGHRALWIRTTVANNDALQAAEIIAAMGLNSNVDPDIGP